MEEITYEERELEKRLLKGRSLDCGDQERRPVSKPVKRQQLWRAVLSPPPPLHRYAQS